MAPYTEDQRYDEIILIKAVKNMNTNGQKSES